jgi:hypothetical protein
MVLINGINNMSTPLLVTAFSFIMVIFFCSQNNLVSGKSVNVLETYDGWGKYFSIQDDSKNNLNDPSSVFDKKSESTNQNSSGSLDEGQTNDNTTQSGSSALDEGQTNDNTTQSGSSALDEGQTNVNTSESVATNQVQNNNQSQVQNNNQSQVQNSNQNVNINNQIQTQQRLESIITEREGEKPIPLEEQKRIESEDQIVIREHKSLTGPNCRTGDVLNGASNEKDLKVLSECQEAVGIVKHTKKMDDGDYKFFLDVDKKYDFLLNDKNNQKTDGFLVVEIVPKDQDIAGISLPKSGDQVHIWGAWVTDKPKGWHEIHPAWKVGTE